MFRYGVYTTLFYISGVYAFHESPELTPLLNQNSVELRTALRNGLTKVRTVEVIERDGRGVPREFNETYFIECAKCSTRVTKGVCSCSNAELPDMTTERLLSSSPVRDARFASLPLPDPVSRRPNRCMQALIACCSFPQALCYLCAQADDAGAEPEPYSPHAYYDEHVGSFEPSAAYADNECCQCMWHFCPCCVPQEDIGGRN